MAEEFVRKEHVEAFTRRFGGRFLGVEKRMEQGFAHAEKAREQNFVHLNQHLDSLEKDDRSPEQDRAGDSGRDSDRCGEVPVYSRLIEGLCRGSVNERLFGSNEHPPIVPRTLGILKPDSVSQPRPERVSFG